MDDAGKKRFQKRYPPFLKNSSQDRPPPCFHLYRAHLFRLYLQS